MTSKVPADLRRLLQRLSGTVFVTDGQGVVREWSEGARRALGYEGRQVIGRPCHAFLDGHDPFGNRYCVPDCPVLQACRGGEDPRPHQLSFRLADGEYRTFVCAVSRVTGRRPDQLFLLYQLHEGAVAPRAAAEPSPTGRGCGDPGSRPPPPVAPYARGGLDALSPREREVLGRLAQGLSTKQVAAALAISQATARNHVQAILRKLAVHTKLEAVVLAHRHGLVS